jgi:hypothetical protein
MRTLQPTPTRLVQDGRVVEYGLFERPFERLELDQVAIYDPRVVPAALQRLRLKEWQHVAVVSEELTLGLAIIDTQYLGSSFVYVAEHADGRYTEHHREVAPGRVQLARTLYDGWSTIAARRYRIRIRNRLAGGYHRLSFEVAASRRAPALWGELELTADLSRVQPLVAVLPLGPNRPLYTHKAPCPVRGVVGVGERRYLLDPARDLALLDVQKTYYPYRTWWRWATFAGYDDRGRVLAANLVHNVIERDEVHNENVVWIDGDLVPVGAARFRAEDGLEEPWKVATTDGRCKLDFTPRGRRSGRIQLGLVSSDYHQPYGRFSGEIMDRHNRTIQVNELSGVTERHNARF